MFYEIDYEEAYFIGYGWGERFTDIEDASDISDGVELCDRIDYLVHLAFEAEGNARQFADFRAVANYINKSECPGEAWKAFDEGVADAIRESVAALYT